MADLKFTRQELISLCRLCLAKDLASIDIFETGSEVRQLFTKIVACLPIHITTGDSLPHKICEVCNSKVDDFYQFWTRTAQNQKQLNEWFQLCTDDDQKTIVPTIKVEADDTRQDEEYDDYDDGGQGDDSDDDEDAPSAAKRIKTQDSGDEDQKPTDLDAILENSTDVNGQKDGSSKKKAKEKQWSVHAQEEDSSLKTRKFECEVCGKMFKTKKESRRHTKRVHFNSKKTFECEQCADRFATSEKLEKHVEIVHLKIKQIKHHGCQHCVEIFPTPYKLNKHIELVHPTIEKSNKNEPMDTGDYSMEEWKKLVASRTKQCPVCHKVYCDPIGMRRHLREVHTSQKKYICDICGKQFTGTKRVAQHKKVFHLKHKPVQIKKYQCDYCKKLFRSKYFLTEHMSTHTGYYQYHCELCKKSFACKKSYTRDLKRHKQIAGELNSDEIHTCKICNKSFLEITRLRNHMESVHGNKHDVCKVCGAKVKCSSLRRHMMSHTGEKPYCCHICGKSMRAKLKEHMLTHTGERPHACDVCGSTFKYKYYLNVHMRKHTGEKPYRCQFCTQCFASRPSFTLHLKKHA